MVDGEKKDLGSRLLREGDHRGKEVVGEEVHSTLFPGSIVDSLHRLAEDKAWIRSSVGEDLLDSRLEGENEDQLEVGKEGDDDSNQLEQSKEEPKMEAAVGLVDLRDEVVERGRAGDEVVSPSQMSIGYSAVLRRDSVVAEVGYEGEGDGEEENRSLMVVWREGTEVGSDNSVVSTASDPRQYQSRPLFRH